MKKVLYSEDSAMHNVVSVIKASVRAKSDIVYTREEGEFKVILPYADERAHHVPLKRLRDRLSKVLPELEDPSGARKRFDINVAGVNVLLHEAEFDYMDEADRERYLTSEKTGNRFAVFHGKFFCAEEDACV